MQSTRSGVRNESKLYPISTNLDVRKFSFSVRVTCEWNNLGKEITDAPSVNCFKNRLDKYYEKKSIYYENYKANYKHVKGTGVVK